MKRAAVLLSMIGLAFAGCTGTASAPTTTADTVVPQAHPTTTSTTCAENPQAKQWAQQAESDNQAAAAIDRQFLNDAPNSKQYNADDDRLKNAELATSNDLNQLHANDNCGLYQSFSLTSSLG